MKFRHFWILGSGVDFMLFSRRYVGGMGFDYVWHGGQHPPANLPITQVYGYVFDEQGRVVIFQDEGVWNLPGVH